MDRGTVILTTLIVYKIVLICIGFWAQKRNKDNTDYFLGGRQLGPVVASISYAASSSSAWVLLGFSGASYVVGAPFFWFIPGAIIGHWAAWAIVAPRLRVASKEKGLITATDVLVDGVVGPMRAIIVGTASLFVLFCFIFYVAAQFQAAGTTFSTSFSLSLNESIILGGVIVLVYTLLGGFWAVSLTDTLQGLLMAAVSVALPVAAVIAVGGFGPLYVELVKTLKPEQLSLIGPYTGMTAFGFVVGLASAGLGTFGQPHLVTRFMALQDEKALRIGRIIAVSWFAVVYTGMFILGLSAHILVGPIENAESLFFVMTDQLFPSIIAGITIAASLSAIMSTADSQLLVAASAIAHDLGLEKVWPGHGLTISRLVIAGTSFLAIGIALFLPSDVFTRVLFAWSSLGAAFGPLIIMRALKKTLHPIAAYISMVSGFALTVYFYLQPDAPGDVLERTIPFFVAFVPLLLGARSAKPKTDSAPVARA